MKSFIQKLIVFIFSLFSSLLPQPTTISFKQLHNPPTNFIVNNNFETSKNSQAYFLFFDINSLVNPKVSDDIEAFIAKGVEKDSKPDFITQLTNIIDKLREESKNQLIE